MTAADGFDRRHRVGIGLVAGTVIGLFLGTQCVDQALASVNLDALVPLLTDEFLFLMGLAYLLFGAACSLLTLFLARRRRATQ